MPKGNNQNVLNGINPLAYLGVNPSSPSDTVFYDFDPTPTDNNFDIGTVWINTTPLLNNVWFLTSLAFGVATWILVGTFNGEVNTLTADNVLVPPIADNINILGDGINIHTVGNAVTATIAITLDDTITLPATNIGGTAGVINIGAVRFVSGLDQNIPKTNSFFGPNAGNVLGTLIGTRNTGIGFAALNDITAGDDNTTLGSSAGSILTVGNSNTFIGSGSGIVFINGNQNTSVGCNSLMTLNAALLNTAIGYNSLSALATGSDNIALGSFSGNNFTTNESNNIIIGNDGIILDNRTIRIGTNGNQTATYIVGIDGVNVGSVAKVVTENADQLGTATITAGAGISVTPGANTITIAATTAFFTWTVVAINTPIVKQNGYIANGAGTLTFSLPAVSAVGDEFAITGMNNATGWQVTQGAGQQIFIGLANTTLGAAGTLTSSATRDSIQCVCIVANLTWQVISMIGNVTVV